MAHYTRYRLGGQRLSLHRKIWEKYHQQKIPKNWVVHHKDGNKRNNDIKNLVAMTRSDHSRLHVGQIKKNGCWLTKCKSCGLLKDVEYDFYKHAKSMCVSCRRIANRKHGKYRTKYNSEICPCCGSKVLLGVINKKVLK